MLQTLRCATTSMCACASNGLCHPKCALLPGIITRPLGTSALPLNTTWSVIWCATCSVTAGWRMGKRASPDLEGDEVGQAVHGGQLGAGAGEGHAQAGQAGQAAQERVRLRRHALQVRHLEPAQALHGTRCKNRNQISIPYLCQHPYMWCCPQGCSRHAQDNQCSLARFRHP